MPLQENRPFSQVFGSIVNNTQDIIRSEVHLAKAEIREELSAAARPVATWVAGIVLGLYAFGFALLAATYGLSLVLQPWLAALIVAGGVGIVAMGLVAGGKARLKRLHTPTKTIESMKENVEWAKHQIR